MATITWTDATGDGLWSSTGNWDSGTLPVAGDTVRFTGDTGRNCTLDVDTPDLHFEFDNWDRAGVTGSTITSNATNENTINVLSVNAVNSSSSDGSIYLDHGTANIKGDGNYLKVAAKNINFITSSNITGFQGIGDGHLDIPAGVTVVTTVACKLSFSTMEVNGVINSNDLRILQTCSLTGSGTFNASGQNTQPFDVSGFTGPLWETEIKSWTLKDQIVFSPTTFLNKPLLSMVLQTDWTFHDQTTIRSLTSLSTKTYDFATNDAVVNVLFDIHLDGTATSSPDSRINYTSNNHFRDVRSQAVGNWPHITFDRPGRLYRFRELCNYAGTTHFKSGTVLAQGAATGWNCSGDITLGDGLTANGADEIRLTTDGKFIIEGSTLNDSWTLTAGSTGSTATPESSFDSVDASGGETIAAYGATNVQGDTDPATGLSPTSPGFLFANPAVASSHNHIAGSFGRLI